MRRSLHRLVMPRGRDAIIAHQLSRIDFDELRRRAEEFGRRITAMFFEAAGSETTPEELKARIRAISARRSTKGPSGKPVQRDSRVSATLIPQEDGPIFQPRM
jgi:hypothetical protein